MPGTITIHEDGRSGTVRYSEVSGELIFSWELGGGEVVAIISTGDEVAWSKHPWAAMRRSEILRQVADELVRQKAPTSRAEISEATGQILLRQGYPTRPRHAPDVAFVRRFSALKAKLGLAVLAGALILGGVMWFKQKVLMIDPGKGTPLGLCVRSDMHIATMIQTLESYSPSLNRDHGKDTYAVSIFIWPLDGAAPRHIPIKGGLSPNNYQLSKVLGSDGHTLWFDVLGVGGLDLQRFELVPAGLSPAPGVPLSGAHASPFPMNPEDFLCAGFLTGPKKWLGLHSSAEVEGEFAPKKFLRRVVRQVDAKGMRRFQRAELDDPVDDKYHRILSFTPLSDEEYLNAAFLRIDDRSEPMRLSDPDGALMAHTSEAGMNGKLMIARVDTAGKVIWNVDTGIDRLKLQQILPGNESFAFVGTRPPVADKVSEPLLVIVDSRTGAVIATSLWQ